MNSASELMHDGVGKLVWHKDYMSLFCLSLRVCTKGVVHASVGL